MDTAIFFNAIFCDFVKYGIPVSTLRAIFHDIMRYFPKHNAVHYCRILQNILLNCTSVQKGLEHWARKRLR